MAKNLAMLVLAIGLIFAGYVLLVSYNKTEPVIIIDPLPQPVVYKDLIKVSSPNLGQSPLDNVSPIKFWGEARGNWYFEASFPVQVLNEDRTVLGTGIAQAQGEWMTSEYVPFRGEVVFDKPKGKNGFIVFRKDNPSGLPEHDDALEIPIMFE